MFSECEFVWGDVFLLFLCSSLSLSFSLTKALSTFSTRLSSSFFSLSSIHLPSDLQIRLNNKFLRRKREAHRFQRQRVITCLEGHTLRDREDKVRRFTTLKTLVGNNKLDRKSNRLLLPISCSDHKTNTFVE